MNALLILCVGGVLTGAANAVRELVKERVIYRRERAVGLSRSAYLMSKSWCSAPSRSSRPWC
ncbi:hypothetical protein SANTM175S_08828 [Streptomyces antimycoticus]